MHMRHGFTTSELGVDGLREHHQHHPPHPHHQQESGTRQEAKSLLASTPHTASSAANSHGHPHGSSGSSASASGSSGLSLLLPSSLLPLALQAESLPSPTLTASDGANNSSLMFSAAQLIDATISRTSSPTSKKVDLDEEEASATRAHRIAGGADGEGLALPGRRGEDGGTEEQDERYSSWFDGWLSPASSQQAELAANRQQQQQSAVLVHQPLTPPSSSALSSTSSSHLTSGGDSGSSIDTALTQCVRLTTFLLGLLVVVFLLVLAFEYHRSSAEQSARLDRLAIPESERVQVNYATLIQAQELAVGKQREVNDALLQLNERDTRIHSLHTELVLREKALASYKKVVHRLKALQLEHAEAEKRTRSFAAVDAALGSSDAHLVKYREKLMHLIFGNQTLAESRLEYEREKAAGAPSEDIFRIVREEAAERKKGGVGEFIRGGGAEKELKVESVMRIQELSGHLLVGGGGGAGAGGSSDDAGAGGGGSDGGLNPDGSPSSPDTKVAQLPADKLVDSDKNEYILSKPGDSSKKTVDTRLVLDLGIVIVASAIGGLLASAARQPILLGYLVGGSFIGPGGARLIGQFIQIETLAQFGATFLLFALGVEFSVSKLRKVKHIAFLGGGLQLVGCVLLVSLFGVYLLDLRLKQSIFVGCVLSMSSTTVVVKSLMERKQIATLCGQVMLGLLIVQDLFLSLMLALVNLARVPWEHLGEEAAWLLLKFAVLGVIVVACMYLWPICLRALDQSKSQDLFLLGLVALCVFLTVVSEKIIASAEVGAFLSGILISSSPGASQELTHRSLRLFGPIRDMFGALFFCSIGMLIDPIFVVRNAATIATLVLGTVVLKSVITLAIVRLFGYSLDIAVRTGVGLSQIGEFAFVLSSEGVALGLITGAQYHFLVATTAVSLFFTPTVIWLGEYLLARYHPHPTGVGRMHGG